MSLRSKKWFVFAAPLMLVTVACGGPSSSVEENTSDFTTAPSAQGSGADKVTSCHGTEPFWDVTIDDAKVQFKNDANVMTIANGGPIAAQGSIASFVALYQGRTTESPDTSLNVIITTAEGGCSNSMSEERFPYSVSVLSGNTVYTGCCAGR